jgi:hypothetical protein
MGRTFDQFFPDVPLRSWFPAQAEALCEVRKAIYESNGKCILPLVCQLIYVSYTNLYWSGFERLKAVVTTPTT